MSNRTARNPSYSPREGRAAAVVAFVLDARAVPRDLGGRRIRDFDLVLRDGTIEPLEITTAARQTTLQTWARVEALNREAPTLSKAWTLSVPVSWPDASGNPAPFKARDFIVAAEPLLRELEQLGVVEFDTARWTGGGTSAGAVVARFVGLGCDVGMSHPLEPGETGRIYLSSGPGGFADPNSLAASVEREASKADNIAKLSESSNATRRHLFVIVDGSVGAAFVAAYHGALGRLPSLPAPITTAWVGAGDAVHVATPPAPWKSHAIPADVFDHPERWIDEP